ncbi:hypothetical protein ACFL59_06670 [Planctomycetota bacterium]
MSRRIQIVLIAAYFLAWAFAVLGLCLCANLQPRWVGYGAWALSYFLSAGAIVTASILWRRLRHEQERSFPATYLAFFAIANPLTIWLMFLFYGRLVWPHL